MPLLNMIQLLFMWLAAMLREGSCALFPQDHHGETHIQRAIIRAAKSRCMESL